MFTEQDRIWNLIEEHRLAKLDGKNFDSKAEADLYSI